MKSRKFNTGNSRICITEKIVSLFSSYNDFCILNSNTDRFEIFPNPSYRDYDVIAGAGSRLVLKSANFNSLKELCKENNDWVFGHMCYDLKNETESCLYSSLPDSPGFSDIFFFVPEIVILVKGNDLIIYAGKDSDCERVFKELNSAANSKNNKIQSVPFSARMDRSDYGKHFRELKNHIQAGNIYEITFCREFFSEAVIDPYTLYNIMCERLPAPFSALYRNGSRYLISASPERFIKKKGNKIISQPMKGTYRRSDDPAEDELLKKALSNDLKERSENVMITDLVRNDLSRTAKKGSVKVEDLFGVYTFPRVHQMVSTVVAEMKENIHFTDVIKNTFPMGSMTGAPKIRAMQLIEEHESVKRGLFSGSVGYISPEGDFDFNVIIRSLLYNKDSRYLSLSAGGAITSLSDEENEYAETELKANSVFSIFR